MKLENSNLASWPDGAFSTKKSRFSGQRIAFILRQAEEGTTIDEVCRKAKGRGMPKLFAIDGAMVGHIVARLLTIFLVVALTAPRHSQATGSSVPNPLSSERRPALVFNIDQGFPFGIIENRDLTSLGRILAVVAKFKRKFDVYVLINPLTQKRENLHAVLQTVAAHEIPFLLDAYTSDAMTVSNVLVAANADADPPHGLPLSLARLRQIKKDPALAAFFAGLRFMEVQSTEFTVEACRERSTGPNRIDWCDHFARNVPADAFLQAQIALPLLDFAKENGMWVLWSDWKWDTQTTKEEALIGRWLALGAYVRTVVLTYANNLPREEARDNDANWRQWRAAYAPLVRKQVRGLGLSDQAWACDDQVACPADVLIRWVARAINSQAEAIEFEPSWYFFELPSAEDRSYPDSPQWRHTGGRPTDQIVLLAASLGVDIANSEPTPSSSTKPNQAVCVALDTVEKLLKPGTAFVASATFQNTGVNPWKAEQDQLSQTGGDQWSRRIFPLTRELVKPGEQVRFSLDLRAPTEPGWKRLELRMQEIGKSPFGQTCSLLLRVAP